MSDKVIHTRKRYFALAGVFVLLGLILVFRPDKDNTKKLQPETLLIGLNDNSRLISTDQVADRLINNDPSMILVDVRSPEEYAKGTLPGAMNIPLAEILSTESLKLFNRAAYDKVIFANNDVLSNQAWVLLKGKLVERTFLMTGGINGWVRTIINPEMPPEEAPIEAFELYNARLGASRFFAGQSVPFEFVEPEAPATRVVKETARPKIQTPALPPPPAAEEEEEEGC
jgi:rhodanese-related sulfurtransferase